MSRFRACPEDLRRRSSGCPLYTPVNAARLNPGVRTGLCRAKLGLNGLNGDTQRAASANSRVQVVVERAEVPLAPAAPTVQERRVPIEGIEAPYFRRDPQAAASHRLPMDYSETGCQ